MRLGIAIALTTIWLAGCGGGGTPLSCSYSSAGKCFDYGNVSQEVAQSLCIGGSVQQSACSTTSRVGSCTRGDIVTRYYSPTFSNTSAQSDCSSGEGGGTYEPG